MIKLKTIITNCGEAKQVNRFEPWLYLQSPISKFAITVDLDTVTVECAIALGWAGMDAPTVRREFEDFKYRAGCQIERDKAVQEAIAFCALYQTKIFEIVCEDGS